MPDLKELLGENYTPELESALSEMYVPKANAQGEAIRLQNELAARDKKLKEIEIASLSEQERLKREHDEAVAAAKAAESLHVKALSKLTIQKGISDSGIAIDDDMLDLISNCDTETSSKIASGLQKLFKAAHAAGEAAANQKHLSNNKAPEGGTNQAMISQAEIELKKARDSGNVQDIAYWTRVVQQTKK